MVVFSNARLGPAAELLVSPAVARGMLLAAAEAAREAARARWELELVRWLDERAGRVVGAAAPAGDRDVRVDVEHIAWTPENFERQRQFVVAAIQRAADHSEHARALARWAGLVEAHPRAAVQVGRRWIWQPTA